MSYQIRGLNQMLKDVEERLNGERAQAVKKAALKAGAAAFKKELLSQLETFKDDGHTIEEVQFSEPEMVNGELIVKVFWRGPHHRYSIIHLNEFGTVKHPKPRGKGKIALALRNSEKAYRAAVREVLRNI